MRHLSADYIFSGTSAPVMNGVITVDEKGKIVELAGEHPLPTEKIEYYKGILCPGFVNVHCHLELSHLKGLIPPKTGLPEFIINLQKLRNNFSPEIIASQIANAEQEMLDNGIVAVGDISNNHSTVAQKQQQKLRYYQFIETFGFEASRADSVFETANALQNKFKESIPGLPCSIVPHAPYSVSELLFHKIALHNESDILTIHNQESAEENLLYINKQGKFTELLRHYGIDISDWKPTGLNALPSVIRHFPAHKKILLVHNTYTGVNDIETAESHSRNIWWCFCPNANLYIEGQLPDVGLFVSKGVKITIGTDSYASNTSLSVLEELKTISHRFPAISLETLLMWATRNGADLLGFQKELGTFEIGKTPGINLIENIDLKTLRLTKDSRVRKLIIDY